MNQHRSICGAHGPPVQDHPQGVPGFDTVTQQEYPLCDCGLEKCFAGDDCEMNKFDDMIDCLRLSNPRFSQLVTLDVDYQIFTRAWCVAELVQGRKSNCQQILKVAVELDGHEHGFLEVLDVRHCESSRPEDKAAILENESR